MSRLPIPIRGRYDFISCWVVLALNVYAIVWAMAQTANGEPLSWWSVLNGVIGWHYFCKLYDHYRFERMLRDLHERFPNVR